MLITEYWYNYPITYNKEKYRYEDNFDGTITFTDKKNKHMIFHVLTPILIKQITDNEFIIVHSKSRNIDNNFIFVHLRYNESSRNVTVIYQKEYKSKSAFGEIIHFDDIYLMETWLNTTIYNSKTNQSLTLEDSNIQKGKQELKDTHLIAKVKIKNQDNLMMYIDKNTLKFHGFYSQLQERWIPIQNISSDFMNNFQYTVKQEVLKYLFLLQEMEKNYQEFKEEKTENLLRNRLIHKI